MLRRSSIMLAKRFVEIKQHFKDHSNCSMWQRFRTNRRLRTEPPPPSAASLPDQLNTFLPRVREPPPAPLSHNQHPSHTTNPHQDVKQPMAVHQRQVRRALLNINSRKATGPDGGP